MRQKKTEKALMEIVNMYLDNYDELYHFDEEALRNTIFHLFKVDSDKNHFPELMESLKRPIMRIDEFFRELESENNVTGIVDTYAKNCKHSYRMNVKHTASMTSPLPKFAEYTIDWLMNKLSEPDQIAKYVGIIRRFAKLKDDELAKYKKYKKTGDNTIYYKGCEQSIFNF